MPNKLNDGDLTTAFRPNETKNGSLIYHISDENEIGRLNILQSGNAISNAKVSVRTGADTWVELGRLNESFTAFYTADLENVYDVKLEWEDIVPTIYEIITLVQPGDVLDKNIKDAQIKLNAAKADASAAQETLTAVSADAAAAEGKIAAAASKEDKLRAEIAFYQLKAKESEAKIVLLEKNSVSAACEARLARAEAKKLEVEGSEDEAAQKEAEADQLIKQADAYLDAISGERALQSEAEQKAKDKQNELEQLLNTPKPPVPDLPNPPAGGGDQKDPQPVQPSVKSFQTKTLKYKVVNASAKTVTVTGPVKKSLSSATIPATVKYRGVTYKVVQIKDNAFKNCRKLQKVTIGSNVKKIGKQAFSGCGKLKTINMKKAAKVTSFGNKAFSKIHAKATVTVPAKKLKTYKNALKKAGLPKKASVKK